VSCNIPGRAPASGDARDAADNPLEDAQGKFRHSNGRKKAAGGQVIAMPGHRINVALAHAIFRRDRHEYGLDHRRRRLLDHPRGSCLHGLTRTLQLTRLNGESTVSSEMIRTPSTSLS
jgi:hypothetical protein